jgi:H2-forming N5,N10-methylenetetrahydromethanopterin dehydrogenase-like enzyme
MLDVVVVAVDVMLTMIVVVTLVVVLTMVDYVSVFTRICVPPRRRSTRWRVDSRRML